MEEEKKQLSKGRKKKRLVLIPLPFQGHTNPMLQLATILHSNGFSITIVHTLFNFPPNVSKYPNFTFVSMPDGLSSSDLSGSADVVDLLCLLNQNCISPLKECLIQIIKEEEGVCIISDAMMHFTRGVADELKLPRLVLRTSSAECFLVFASLPLLRDKGYIPLPTQESELEALIPEIPPLRVKDLPMINSHLSETLYQLLADMVQTTKASSGLILNSFESLEQLPLSTLRKDFPIPVFLIGPFHRFIPASSSSILTPDRSCISWLDTQSPGTVLYVSFGSIADMTQTDFLEVAWGLANSQQPFLWVIRPGLVRGNSLGATHQLLPQSFHDMVSGRSCIVKWAPQQEVLAHPAVGGFWTHNGWNSTLESICEGVPMLCWPCLGDQTINARYVSDVWRIGLLLKHGLKREEMESSIRSLMVIGKEREEIMVRINKLKKDAELCWLKGGSSSNSLQNLVDLISSF